MPSAHAKYPDVVTSEDVNEMIRRQTASEIKRRGLKVAPELTPFAIKCVRHGRVVLTLTEAEDVMRGNMRAKCPHCRVERPMDQFWYQHTKELLFF